MKTCSQMIRKKLRIWKWPLHNITFINKLCHTNLSNSASCYSWGQALSYSGRLLLRLVPGAQGYIPAGCILSLSAGFQTNTVKQHRQRCVSKYKKDQTYILTVEKNLHSSLSMGILQSQPTMWQAQFGLIAQLVEHCTRIAEVMGWNVVETWIFFRF